MDRVSDSRFKGRRFESRRRQILFLFIEKFTKYFQTFIYILAGLSLCVICICQVNACISQFDLLLSTYSKWQYNDQFPPYVVYMCIAHFHITHFPNLIILIVTKFMLTISEQISNHASWEDITVIFHVNPMCIYLFAKHQSQFLLNLSAPMFSKWNIFIFMVSIDRISRRNFDMPWQTVAHLSVASSTHLSRSEFSKSHLLSS